MLPSKFSVNELLNWGWQRVSAPGASLVEFIYPKNGNKIMFNPITGSGNHIMKGGGSEVITVTGLSGSNDGGSTPHNNQQQSSFTSLQDDKLEQRQNQAAGLKEEEKIKAEEAAAAEKAKKEKEAAAQVSSGQSGGGNVTVNNTDTTTVRGSHANGHHGPVNTSPQSPAASGNGLVSEHGQGMNFATDNNRAGQPKHNAGPTLTSEHGQNGGYMPGTNVRPENPAQIAANADKARGEALNEHYHLGDYATKDTAPAPAWGTSMAPNLGGIGGSAITDHGNALATRDSKDGKKIIVQMSDGSYQSVDKVTGDVAGAGTWGDGAGGGKAVNGIGAPPPLSSMQVAPTSSAPATTSPTPTPGPYIGTLPQSSTIETVPAANSTVQATSVSAPSAPQPTAQELVAGVYTPPATSEPVPVAAAPAPTPGPYIGTLPASAPAPAPTTSQADLALATHRFQVAENKSTDLFTLPAGGGESHVVSDFTPDVSNTRVPGRRGLIEF